MSERVFNTQTYLGIRVEVGEDLTNATDIVIKFENPRGVRGEFPATVVDALTGLIEYIPPVGQPLAIAGIWKFWAHFEIAGRTAPCTPFQREIYPEGL